MTKSRLQARAATKPSPREGVGRERLSPEVVAAFRRERLIEAIAELSRERGYRETSVADVAARTRMGRGTIYGLFPSREALFLAALDHAVEGLRAGIEAACGGAGEYPERLRRGLAAALAWVAEQPALAYVLLVDSVSATASAAVRHREALDGLTALLRSCAPENPRLPPDADHLVVGGIAAVLARNVQGGRAAAVPDLLPELAAFVLGPQRFA